MRNKSIALVFLLLVLNFFSHQTLSAQDVYPPSVLQLKAHVYDGEDKVEKAVIEFYQNEKLVKKMMTKKNGRFQFLLFKGNEYKVKIAKAGFVKEYIVVATKNTQDFSDKKYFFEFALDLKSVKKFKSSGVTEFDFPSAKISFSLEDDEYTHDKFYHKMVKEKIDKLK